MIPIKILALTLSSGQAAIMRIYSDDITYEDHIRKYEEASLPPRTVISAREITKDDIPSDRTFRDALIDDGATLVHDIAKAREIAKDKRAQKGKIKKDAEIDSANTISALLTLIDAQ